jgi:glycerol uptake facilitator-like aquaporin
LRHGGHHHQCVGPRLFALLAGWGAIAVPGPDGILWAYIVGPFLGGPAGATL